jgi:hypothetical protein
MIGDMQLEMKNVIPVHSRLSFDHASTGRQIEHVPLTAQTAA